MTKMQRQGPDPADVVAGDLRTTSSLLAVAGLFVVNGLLIGGIGGTLPAMRARLGVGTGGLAVMLVSLTVAAVASMQVGGRLSDSRGARSVALPACALLILGVGLLAFAPNLPFAAAAMAVAGLGNGAMDVSMNAIGVRVEAVRPKPVMSRLHACFSIGNLAGAGTVILVARLVGERTGTVTPTLATLVLFSVGAGALILRWLPETSPFTDVTRSAGWPRLPAGAWLLGAMAFSFGLAEGTAVDWSSVHVTDVARVSPSTGAWGLVAVSSFMVVVRLFGDRAVAAFGRVTVVRAGGLTAAAGYLVAILGQAMPVLLAGWALVGLGVGLIAPQVYAAAGHAGGGRMLAVVVTFGYGAFLVGPAIIGGLIGQVGIRHTMALPLCLALVLVALSGGLPRSGQAGEAWSAR
jgi:MFS family permease